MRITLRSLFLAPVILAATAFAATTAQAEATLKVPFSFSVNGKTLPAGYYSLNRDITHNLVTLRSKNSAQSFTWLIGPGKPAPDASDVTLKFAADNNAYTLRTVQYGSLITSRLDKSNKHNEHVHVETITGQ